ncbi:MAG: glutamate formimidoyltransferase [Planctomycetes bacterium]|nr:glutamate formimidoyltransferase [Planctomycetota bacterium]
MKIVECVPNFSEGRRPDVIDQIVKVISSVKGITFLDKEMDANHNRAVLTFIGPPEGVKLAAFRAAEKAVKLIDMTKHKGEHPRIGATDVVPFVPIQDVAMADCVALAREVGKSIGEKLRIPVYLYEEAATRPERKNLANIRKGEFEGLRDEMGTNPERKPDFGPDKIHPTAGATVVGAREILVAYNINLKSDNQEIAKRIARTIRESHGGLLYVKALGVMLERNGAKIAQVTMNLTNYKITPVKKAFDAVKTEAAKYKVEILESELIGLAPQDAFKEASPQELLITNFNPKQIIENRI